MLRPGIVGMRRSMVTRLRPCMIRGTRPPPPPAMSAWSVKTRHAGIAGMRGSMVMRLRPCMRSSTSLLSSPPRPLPPPTHRPNHRPTIQVFFTDALRLARDVVGGWCCWWWDNQPTHQPTHPATYHPQPIPTNLYLSGTYYSSNTVLEQLYSNRFNDVYYSMFSWRVSS